MVFLMTVSADFKHLLSGDWVAANTLVDDNIDNITVKIILRLLIVLHFMGFNASLNFRAKNMPKAYRGMFNDPK